METEQWQAAADCGDIGYWAVYSLAGRKRALVFDPANARLIAAAPDLLAALESLCDGPLLIDDTNAKQAPREEAMRRYKIARAAIAKARGQ
jgi:hypothetical protein